MTGNDTENAVLYLAMYPSDITYSVLFFENELFANPLSAPEVSLLCRILSYEYRIGNLNYFK